VVEREIKRDTAVTAMAILMAPTTTSALLTYWTSQRISAAMIAAPTTFFLVGGITSARLVLDNCPDGLKHRFGPIGLKRGFMLSAVLSACTILPIVAVTWFATLLG